MKFGIPIPVSFNTQFPIAFYPLIIRIAQICETLGLDKILLKIGLDIYRVMG